MAFIKYPSSSPYAETPQNSWRLGLYVHRPIPPGPGDTTITLTSKYANRPDRLSYDLYGTDNYWWVFMLRNINVIRDPMFGLRAGLKIVVPTLDHLKTVLK